MVWRWDFGLKFMCIWEYEIDKIGEIIEKFKKGLKEIQEKGTINGLHYKENFPAILLEGHLDCGENVAYTLYEAETSEQLTNAKLFWGDLIKNARYVPVLELSKLAEQYEKIE
jgi:hypothetical protein